MAEPTVETIGTVGGWAAVLTLIGVIVRQVVPWWKLKQEGDAKLIDVLAARVEKLEQALEQTRTHYENKIDRLQAEYEAGQRIARHELANAKMRFRALVMLLKRLPNPPAGLTEILSDIETMEMEQSKAEALEKGAASGAKIAGTGSTPPTAD